MGDVVRAFSRPVGVDQRYLRVLSQPGAAKIRRQLLAGRHQPAQAGEARGDPLPGGVVEQGAQERRDDLQDRDLLTLDGAQQPQRIVRDLVAEDVHSAADQQCGEHLPDRDVEALGGVLR